MKTCLLCDHQEPGKTKASPNVSYVCSRCVRSLVGAPRQEVAERYVAAVEADKIREAYALYSFVPRKVREEHPIAKTRLKQCSI